MVALGMAVNLDGSRTTANVPGSCIDDAAAEVEGFLNKRAVARGWVAGNSPYQEIIPGRRIVIISRLSGESFALPARIASM
jgi:hypothetical protein